MKFWLPYFTILTALPCYASSEDLNKGFALEQQTIINQEWGMVAAVIKLDKSLAAQFSLIDVNTRKAEDNASNYWSSNKYMLMVNGGYFSHDFSPVGYYKVNDKIINANTSQKLSGYVGIDPSGQISLLNKQELYSSPSEFSTLIQAGPYIIDPNGLLGIHNNNHKRHQRTVIATTFSGDTLVISTAPISLYNLSRALKAELPEIERALNLDGGPSSTLMTSKISLLNRTPVRSYLAVSLSNETP